MVQAGNQAARLRNQAAMYAEQSLEQVRNFYQTNNNSWVTLSGKSSSPSSCGCYTDGTLTTTAGCELCDPSACPLPPADVIHQKFVKVTTSGNQVKIFSIVRWREKGSCQKTVASTYYYDY